MLGGSLWIAFLRNGIGAGLMMAVFLMLDHPRFSVKKTVLCYMVYGVAVVTGYSAWYLIDSEMFIRFAGICSIPVVGAACLLLSRDLLWISMYKLALSFYLLSVVVFCGVDGSRIWFNGSYWADLAIRGLVTAIELWIFAKVRHSFLENVVFLQQEIDLASSLSVLLSILIAAFLTFRPNINVLSLQHVVQVAVLLFMAGMNQYIVYHLYLYQGRERRFRVEKELLEMNEQLLRRQLEILRKSEEEAGRLRHDIRHHCLVMEEYIRNKDMDKLLDYIRQYGEDVQGQQSKRICGNETVNAVLCGYARRAEQEGIQVTMQVKVDLDIPIRDIDLAAILANVFENAIHGCQLVEGGVRKIHMYLVQKGKKMAICCQNSCIPEIQFCNGIPQSARGGGIGVSSVRRTVAYYNGEADFAVKGNMFVARILLPIPDKKEVG